MKSQSWIVTSASCSFEVYDHFCQTNMMSPSIRFIRIPGMDSKKAYIVGLMHDIGIRAGITDIPTHVYDGYKYCMEKGWDEAAYICMTHSYLLMKDEFNYEPETEHEKAIKAYIMNCTADDYQTLEIQHY